MIELKTFVPCNPPNKGNKLSRAHWRGQAALYIPITIYATNEYASKKYFVDIILYFPHKQNVDIDNCMKTVLDSLIGRFMVDDRQIKKLCVEVVEGGEKIGVEIHQQEM